MVLKGLSKLVAGACIIGSGLFCKPVYATESLRPQYQVQGLGSIATKSKEPNRPDKTDRALFWSFNALNCIDAYQTKVRFDRAGIEEGNPFMRELKDTSLYWPVKLGVGYYASNLALKIPDKGTRRAALIGINLLYLNLVLENERQIQFSYRF